MPLKFRIKAGKHIQGGRTYKAGETVVSQNDLSKAFPQKFESLGNTTEPLPTPTGKGRRVVAQQE